MTEAIDLIVGYHQVEPLRHEELTILPDLILMRLIFRILITEWRASLFPADRTYILRNIDRTWADLRSFQTVPRSFVVADLMSRCGAA